VDFLSRAPAVVTAAYFGLSARCGDYFSLAFPAADAEEGHQYPVVARNIGRALVGGVNDSQFPDWARSKLFDGAGSITFREGAAARGSGSMRPTLLQRTPFLFGKTAFPTRYAAISGRIALPGGRRRPRRCRWPLRRVLETLSRRALQMTAALDRTARPIPTRAPLLRSVCSIANRTAIHEGSCVM